MAASNNIDVFREFIGARVVGVLFDAFPLNRADIAIGTKTLIFEDGRGLTFAKNGSYWTEDRSDVVAAIEFARAKVRQLQADLSDVLSLGEVIVPRGVEPETVSPDRRGIRGIGE